MDFAAETGYAEVRTARPKVGEAQDGLKMGLIRVDPEVHPDSVHVSWLVLADAGDRPVFLHGPSWSLEGDRAVVQLVSFDYEDLWIAELDPDVLRPPSFETGGRPTGFGPNRARRPRRSDR